MSPYINYAYESYRSYENLIFGRDRTPQFDPLGQFVLNGATVFQLQEFRTIRPAAGSIIAKPRLYEAYLNRLVIANDSYKGANSQLIVGDRIRTKLHLADPRPSGDERDPFGHSFQGWFGGAGHIQSGQTYF